MNGRLLNFTSVVRLFLGLFLFFLKIIFFIVRNLSRSVLLLNASLKSYNTNIQPKFLEFQDDLKGNFLETLVVCTVKKPLFQR